MTPRMPTAPRQSRPSENHYNHARYTQSLRRQNFTMNLSVIADEGDLTRVRCEGEIANYHHNDEPLEKLLGPEGLKRKVLLNLEKVRFLDSSGIGWLLILHKRCK